MLSSGPLLDLPNIRFSRNFPVKILYAFLVSPILPVFATHHNILAYSICNLYKWRFFLYNILNFAHISYCVGSDMFLNTFLSNSCQCRKINGVKMDHVHVVTMEYGVPLPLTVVSQCRRDNTILRCTIVYLRSQEATSRTTLPLSLWQDAPEADGPNVDAERGSSGLCGVMSFLSGFRLQCCSLHTRSRSKHRQC
jgi:hypothetical protein